MGLSGTPIRGRKILDCVLLPAVRHLKRYRQSSPEVSTPSVSPELPTANLSPAKKPKCAHSVEPSDDEDIQFIGHKATKLLDLFAEGDAEMEDGDRCQRNPSPTVSDLMTRGSYSSAAVASAPCKPDEDDYILETKELAVPSEIPIESDDDDDPIRILNDFVIYDTATLMPVPTECLLELASGSETYAAYGLVSAKILEPDSDEDESVISQSDAGQEIPVRLTEILEFNVQESCIDDYSDDEQDSAIYIRTRFAWYILDKPSKAYASSFRTFFLRHEVLHLAVSLMSGDGYAEWDTLIHALPTINSKPVLRRSVVPADIESDDMVAYIHTYLPQFRSINRKTPLFHDLMHSAHSGGDSDAGSETDDNSGSWSEILDSGTPTVSSTRLKSSSLGKKPHKSEPTAGPPPTVTPIVNHVVKNLFRESLVVAGSSVLTNYQAVEAKIDRVVEHHEEDPETIIWGERIGIVDNTTYYESVHVDGTEYKAGDYVMLHAGVDENKRRSANDNSTASKSPNVYANKCWFCRIWYFYEEHDTETTEVRQMLHVQWLQHGSKTILQETAHSRSLYLTNQCADNPIATIYSKCNIKMLEPGEDEPVDDEDPLGTDFHCGLMWREDLLELVDTPCQSEVAELLCKLPEYQPCIACALTEREDAEGLVSNCTDGSLGFSYLGVDYHPLDFVYILPSVVPKGGHVHRIAQITSVQWKKGDVEVEFQFYGRYDHYSNDPGVPMQEKRLVRLPGSTVLDPNLVDGKCFVQFHLEASEKDDWVQNIDHWLCTEEDVDKHPTKFSEEEFEVCSSCLSNRVARLARGRELQEKYPRLKGLELFCGGGGLGHGMGMSGFVETTCSVEFNETAARTFKLNHPDTNVICQDINVVLKHALDIAEGKKPGALRSKIPCDNFPQPGDIDFVFGGPPCQAFSGANHVPKPDDLRSTLPATMLSVTEFLRPTFFLLENVEGILRYPLMSESSESGHSLEGGIQSGVVKMICRVLVALGYQVRFRLLQAAQYGAPQSRGRVLFWGARRGQKMPSFPVPTHAYLRGCKTRQINNRELKPLSRSRDPQNNHQCAPLKALTVNDAINDLPEFDYVNPHILIPATRKDKEEANNREHTMGISQFDACIGINTDTGLPGFQIPVPYRYAEPQNAYQRMMRKHCRNLVTNHYTPRFKPHVVEAITTVPLKPLACHKDLPIVLMLDCAKPGRKQADKLFYGRLDGHAQFNTALTTANPNSKGSRLLHPYQKRATTVREAARSQGFPDDYKFASNHVNDLFKQIGNAVPVPLAQALGRSLGEVVLEAWDAHARREEQLELERRSPEI